MIRNEQVADLQPGDTVELSWEDGFHVQRTYTGPLRQAGESLYLGDMPVRAPDGMASVPGGQLRVISRAARPLYVNHPRSEPTAGDVVRDADDTGRPQVWFFVGSPNPWPWYSVDPISREAVEDARNEIPPRLRLLVDGETGQVVK